MSFRFYLIIPLIALLGACATVDFAYPKPESTALENTDDTYAGKQIAPLVAEHPVESGFFLLYDGIDALAARLLMAERAERSLDAQYYLITKDLVGYVFISTLLKAADRGVRVRLLLDDIQTKGYDTGMAALDSHPNFEVRVFNPFAGRSGHLGDALGDFGRVNRRMHNKSFTIDNQITLIGGRNIAAEYFSARKDVNFGDVDVVGIGPVVNDVSKMFDIYWNHVSAAPVPAFADMPDDPAEALEQLRIRIDAKLDEIRLSPYADAVLVKYTGFKKGGGSIFTWAPYVLAYDSPDKSIKDKAEEAESITTTLAEAIRNGQKELIVISPYFVPQKRGIAFFQELRDRGMEITVITNSLASTNHAIVHSGYVPSRKPLLKMGVKLYEFKHDPFDVSGVARGGSDASLATLHTKAFIVDRNDLFVGSFNWDPRSIDINTELGVIIESPELGGLTAGLVDESLATRTYEVILNEQGAVRWVDHAGDEPVVLTKEPDTSWWRRFTAGFYRILPVRGQL
jgi:putative cardiolipin synthase